MKKQERILEALRMELTELKTKENPHAELVTFLAGYFDIILEICKKYIKLYNNVVDNFMVCVKSGQSKETINFLKNSQLQNEIETKNKLSIVVKKVLFLIQQCKQVAFSFLGLGDSPIGLNDKIKVDLKKKDLVIEQLMDRYNDAKRTNDLIVDILCKHNLKEELKVVLETNENKQKPN